MAVLQQALIPLALMSQQPMAPSELAQQSAPTATVAQNDMSMNCSELYLAKASGGLKTKATVDVLCNGVVLQQLQQMQHVSTASPPAASSGAVSLFSFLPIVGCAQ